MALEFKLPELGENIVQADVANVLVAEGDQIQKDQPILELETDKAVIEVPSTVSGKVSKVHIQKGDKLSIGQLVLTLDDSISEEKDDLQSNSADQSAEKPIKETVSAPVEISQQEVVATIPQANETLNVVANFQDQKDVAAAPSVRRFARELGIDIAQVPGSGPTGRISKEDVKKYQKALNSQRSQISQGGAIPLDLPDFSQWGSIEKESMNKIRQITAKHMSAAWSNIPHVTQFDEADITSLEKLRKSYGKKIEKQGGKLTVTAVLLKVLAAALKKFPKFNASIDMANREIIYKKYVHIGVAVDTPRGLLVPVIRDVDQKNIEQISMELTELSLKARDGKTAPQDLKGGSFTLTNLGGIGGTAFTPIVNAPEVAILGVARGQWKPIYDGKQFEPKMMLPLSLSYDHRLIDGADGARFIRWVATALEEPFVVSLEG